MNTDMNVMYEAKLGGVNIFRVVLPDELFPQHLLNRKGLFVLNLKSYDDQQQNYPLLEKRVVYFKDYALHTGWFLELSKQVISEIGYLVGPKSQDLIALKISDYLKCCLRYRKNRYEKWFRFPGLVFVVDILVDQSHHEPGPPPPPPSPELFHDINSWFSYLLTKHDFDERLDKNRRLPSINSIDLNRIPFTPAEYHGFLEPDDGEVLTFLYSQLMFHANNLTCSEISTDLLSEVFKKQKQKVEFIHTKYIADDNDICSICLDKMMSTSDLENNNNTITLVRCNSCNHLFHHDCIFKWLPGKHTCPYCRSIMVVDISY